MRQCGHFALILVLFLDFSFLSHKCIHINSLWVPIRRKTMHSLREDVQVWLKEIFLQCHVLQSGMGPNNMQQNHQGGSRL